MSLTQSEPNIAATRGNPVRWGGHVPGWFRIKLLKHFGPCGWHGATTGESLALHHLWRRGWLDHWGASRHGDATSFVSEPYDLTDAERADIIDLAEKLGCNVDIGAGPSWWRHPATTRIEFYQRPEPLAGQV